MGECNKHRSGKKKKKRCNKFLIYIFEIINNNLIIDPDIRVYFVVNTFASNFLVGGSNPKTH